MAVSKAKCVNILDALTRGIVMRINGREHLMDSDGNLCVPCYEKVGGQYARTDELLKIEFADLADFISFCELATDDEYAVICANLALNSEVQPHFTSRIRP